MSEALEVQTALGRLQKVNAATAVSFDRLMSELEPRLDLASRERFAGSCVTIADAGWRSFEPVDTLLEIAADPVFSDRLLAIGRYGEHLSGYSYEPVLSYFRLVLACPDQPMQGVEETGARLHQKYQHASALVGGFFRLAQDLVTDPKECQAWLAVVDGMLLAPRDQFSVVINRTPGEKVSWSLAAQFLNHSASSCLVYLRAANDLAMALPATLGQALALLLRDADHASETLVERLLALVRFPESEQRQILALCDSIPHLAGVNALLANADQLPLARPRVLQQWADAGLDECGNNEAALSAYFGLVSTTANERLARLRGEVYLEDHERTLDLLAETLTARSLLIERASAETSFRAADSSEQLVATDGRSIFLPASVALFDNQRDNFGFYKVSLFHQVSYVEFGCFGASEQVLAAINGCQDVSLAQQLFQILEDARIDWQLPGRYPGLAPQLSRQKNKALALRVQMQIEKPLVTRRAQLIEALVHKSLDQHQDEVLALVDERWHALAVALFAQLESLRHPEAGVHDAIRAMSACHDLLLVESPHKQTMSAADQQAALDEMPPPVSYRGELDVEEIASTRKLEALVEALQEALSQPDETGPQMETAAPAPDDLQLGDVKPGEVNEGVAMLLTELSNELGEAVETPGQSDTEGLLEFLGGLSQQTREAALHRYDEWDYQIGDYRSRWCTLFEHRDIDEDPGYVKRTLLDNQDLSRRIRQQLNKVRPEMLEKVKGVTEGEELDLERSIAYVVDRKAGFTPEERIYVQRQRKARDVSTLFLLDMSASTDDIVPDPSRAAPVAPDIDDDQYLVEYFEQQRAFEADARRIIDLEKESVILMADALASLGDAYSVCGFSGYGRDQVDYYLCKDFDEAFDARARGRIGGIKPCRSTRMGPPIRHGTRRLLQTGSRIKAMIIISDGYPQDHDYGTDRNSREYGLMDTMKALSEAKQQGVLTYCLTVDPSGHDYLRAMCPDSQYMIIQNIEQLPEELSRVYRSLTG